MTANEIRTRVIEAAIAVHRELGPGLLETVCEQNFGEEVMRTGITRCMNGLEGQPLRPCVSAGKEHVQTMPSSVPLTRGTSLAGLEPRQGSPFAPG